MWCLKPSTTPHCIRRSLNNQLILYIYMWPFQSFVYFFQTRALCKRSAKQWKQNETNEREKKKQQKNTSFKYNGLQIKVMQTSERERVRARAHTQKKWYGKALSKSVRIKHKYSATFSFWEVNEEQTTKKNEFQIKIYYRLRGIKFTYAVNFQWEKNMDSFCTKIYTRDCNLDESSCWIWYTIGVRRWILNCMC